MSVKYGSWFKKLSNTLLKAFGRTPNGKMEEEEHDLKETSIRVITFDGKRG